MLISFILPHPLHFCLLKWHVVGQKDALGVPYVKGTNPREFPISNHQIFLAHPHSSSHWVTIKFLNKGKNEKIHTTTQVPKSFWEEGMSPIRGWVTSLREHWHTVPCREPPLQHLLFCTFPDNGTASAWSFAWRCSKKKRRWGAAVWSPGAQKELPALPCPLNRMLTGQTEATRASRLMLCTSIGKKHCYCSDHLGEISCWRGQIEIQNESIYRSDNNSMRRELGNHIIALDGVCHLWTLHFYSGKTVESVYVSRLINKSEKLISPLAGLFRVVLSIFCR